MKAYRYDKDGYFTEVVECQIDPLGSIGADRPLYLIPASSTGKEPLPEKEGFKVKFNGKDWEYEEIPAIPEPTSEELKQQEISELKGKLFASDYAIIKIAEGSATSEEYAELIQERRAWRARINELEGK